MNYFDMLDRGRKAAVYAYLHAQAQAQNFGRGAAGGEGTKEQESSTPTEPIVYDMTWHLVHDDSTWHKAYDDKDAPLRKYYEAHPEEDLWNVAEHRAVNFNDRQYIGIFNGEEVSCSTKWASEKSQKLELNGDIYYCEIWGYNLGPKTVELFDDPELEVTTGQTFEITKVSFSEDCQHCWEGTINAPGAKLPWAVVDTKDQHDLSLEKAKIEFQYNGSNVYPWSEEFRNFPKGFAIASLPNEIGIDPIDAEHTETIDETELAVKGYIENI